MISYCIAAFRPIYCKLLVQDLIKKTSVPYEILIWLNVEDVEFENFLISCPNVKIVGKTPHNIGMKSYEYLFNISKYDMIVQIDDDVIRISRNIAEKADYIFNKFPNIKQLVADTYQDDMVNGARPSMECYEIINSEEGLYQGPIDGWFSIFHKSILSNIKINKKYQYIGGELHSELSKMGFQGLLFTKIKVFHINSPQYAHHFNMLDFEINKYKELGLIEISNLYQDTKSTLASPELMNNKIENIYSHLDTF